MEKKNLFYTYCDLMKIGNVELDNLINSQEFIISENEFKVLCRFGLVSDALSGVLILGKLHSEGGIHCLQPYKNDSLIYVGELMVGNIYQVL